MDIFIPAIAILFILAVSDLIVGVSNDAANFLNSSLGSRVAPRYVIMIIASLGILAGVTFSSGMMEVARKGIFHPQLFTMPDLMVLFLAVMLTDIVLLDLYNTFGLPTSTTVSIVFELLGAAVAVSLVKIVQAGETFGELVNYINTGKAMIIIAGILLSVAVAFMVGAGIQLVTRFTFTFDFHKRLRRYGGIWGGIALASIFYFILIKGSKGASFITPETLAWINSHTWTLLLASFAVAATGIQLLLVFSRINVLKPIVLVGTFALAMAFAANDLVNFIGVPLAGLSAYSAAQGGDMVNQTMDALQKPVQSNTGYLLIAGAVMVVTLWISRKARTVTQTELSLGRQGEGLERFESTVLSQTIVRIVATALAGVRRIVPSRLRAIAARRLERPDPTSASGEDGTGRSFDLLRASVNLMVASMLISFATSLKLPLSTTYVTFMVSMGTSFSDQAWGRESAVYRVTGVLTVIGGWFFTALMAFTVSSLFAITIHLARAPAVIGILALAIFLITRNRKVHRKRVKELAAMDVFNLRKITDAAAAIRVSFEHAGVFLKEVRQNLIDGFDGLVAEDIAQLRVAKKRQKRIQKWANILIANIFKVLRLLQREEVQHSRRYAQTIGTLQEIAESQRDIVMRAYRHVANNHNGLLEVQIEELEKVKACTTDLLDRTADALMHQTRPDNAFIEKRNHELRELLEAFDQTQIGRIQDDTSKTRLSILFYSYMSNSHKIAEQTVNLVELFQNPLGIDAPKRTDHTGVNPGGTSD